MRPKRLWSTYLLGTSRLWAPVIDTIRAYANDFNGPREDPSLYAVALSDGTHLWSARPDAEGGGRLVGVGEAVMVVRQPDSEGVRARVRPRRVGTGWSERAGRFDRCRASRRGDPGDGPRSVMCLNADYDDVVWGVPSQTLWPELVTESDVLCSCGTRGALGIGTTVLPGSLRIPVVLSGRR